MQNFIADNAELYNSALELNYSEFSKMYVDKDQLLDDKKQDEDDENKKGSKRDNLIKHLFKIQTNISLSSARAVIFIVTRYNQILKNSNISNVRAYYLSLKKNINTIIIADISTIISMTPFLLNFNSQSFWPGLALGALGGTLASFFVILVVTPTVLIVPTSPK